MVIDVRRRAGVKLMLVAVAVAVLAGCAPEPPPGVYRCHCLVTETVPRRGGG